MSARALLALTGAGWRRWSAYRAAAAAATFTNCVFGFIRAAITMGAVGAAGGTLAGYDPVQAATYAWLGQALIAPVSVFWWPDLSDRIRSGDIAVDLARPVDPQAAYLAADLGRAAFSLLPRSVPSVAVGALTTGLALSGELVSSLLGAVSVLLAVVISFACRWLVSLAAFWLLEMRGVATVYVVVSNVLCGLAVPVHWFPGWLATVAAATPFPSMLQAPIDVLMGRVTGGAAVAVVLVQLAWAVGVLLAGRLVWTAAVRRVVVQGG